MAVNRAEILDYACLKFDEEKYDEALEAFVLAYMKGYEQQWVIETIYSCYMEGNIAEFRNAFQSYGQKTGMAFEECLLDFIPYRDGEYYIFDKEAEMFLGKFSVSDFTTTEPEPSFLDAPFSGAVVELDWNWEEDKSILSAAKERKMYAVCHDWRRASSFFKIPELAAYAKNMMLFSNLAEFQAYFHQNTAVYLPKIIRGTEFAQELLQIIKQEHEYRLTPAGRNTNNVLLTIGIPTHDRGNLLLKRLETLQKMSYDAEIEIAISKNGTHYFQEEYKSVASIEDARIIYEGYDMELGISSNWQNVVKMAHGKYVLLVSDEDDVIIDALEHYLKLLSDHENLGYVRSRTMIQYNSLNTTKYSAQGREAFVNGFLGQNYISGVIYNKKLFLESNIEYWDKNFRDNAFYLSYPHMWWQVLLAFKGDYATDAETLIWEGKSMTSEELSTYREDHAAEECYGGSSMDHGIPSPSTYESRVKQFQACVALIKDFTEFDIELRSMALIKLVAKTLYLMDMVLKVTHYRPETLPYWLEQLRKEIMLAMDELVIDNRACQYILSDFLDYAKEVKVYLSV